MDEKSNVKSLPDATYCGSCGTKNDGDYSYCVSCGAKLIKNNNSSNNNTSKNSDGKLGKKIYCKKCGAENNSLHAVCVNCGATLNAFSNSEQNNNNNNNSSNTSAEVTDSGTKTLCIVGAIISLLCSAIPYVGILFLILAIVSMFNKKYRLYGTIYLSVFGIVVVTSALFALIIFGLCFAMFG